jgi:hypothetical protein
MSARLYSIQLERHRRIRANGGTERDYQSAFEKVGHSSILAFEQRAMNDDEYARLCRELGGDVGRDATNFLRQVQEVQRWNAAFLLSFAAMAGTIAANILKHSADLLHRASVLSSPNSLAGHDQKKFTRKAEGLRRE